MDKRCPRGLTDYPHIPCQMGRKAVDQARKGKEAGCPWHIADEESCFCFFRYMLDEGNNRPKQPSQIAALLLMDDTEVKNIINKFRETAIQNIELTSI